MWQLYPVTPKIFKLKQKYSTILIHYIGSCSQWSVSFSVFLSFLFSFYFFVPLPLLKHFLPVWLILLPPSMVPITANPLEDSNRKIRKCDSCSYLVLSLIPFHLRNTQGAFVCILGGRWSSGGLRCFSEDPNTWLRFPTVLWGAVGQPGRAGTPGSGGTEVAVTWTSEERERRQLLPAFSALRTRNRKTNTWGCSQPFRNHCLCPRSSWCRMPGHGCHEWEHRRRPGACGRRGWAYCLCPPQVLNKAPWMSADHVGTNGQNHRTLAFLSN